MRVMRNYEEILAMLKVLDKKRNEEIDDGFFNVALAIGAQMELLKWILFLEEKK